MENTENRELRMSKMLNAPIDLVWKVWANPEHITQWWGPDGFTNTIHKMDFREGGEWQLTMLSTEGKSYPNRSIFKEIIPFKKIVFEHFNPHFIVTILFEPVGEKTQIEWSSIFDSEEDLKILNKSFNAKAGQKQNIEKLEKYLNQEMLNKKEQIVIVERIFRAGRDLVWRAITEKEMMKEWYFDLADFKALVGFKFEFIGGSEDGTQYRHLCEVTEVIPEKKLTYSWRYDGYEGISYVEFELFDENENTRLKLTHTGIQTFPAIPDFALHNFETGWNDIINRSLKNFLENNNQ